MNISCMHACVCLCMPVCATFGLFFIIHKQLCKTESIMDSFTDNNDSPTSIYMWATHHAMITHTHAHNPNKTSRCNMSK